MWHDVLRLIELWYFTQVAPLDPRAKKLPLPDELEGELLRYVVSHEIGHALGLRHNLRGYSAYSVQQLRSREFTEKFGNSASIMDYSRFNYVAQPGDNAYLLPVIGVYDYFAIDWGYRVIPGAKSRADQWPELDRLAARQLDDPALRFGGENDAADVDPAVNTHVLSSDPIESTDMGLRNIERVVPMLIPATTNLGQPYYQLSEVYRVLLIKRQKELLSVAKIVGGVEEVRYQGGRGTLPFTPEPNGSVRLSSSSSTAVCSPGCTVGPAGSVAHGALWWRGRGAGHQSEAAGSTGRQRRVPPHGRGVDLPWRGWHIPGRGHAARFERRAVP